MKKISRRTFLYIFASLSSTYPLAFVSASSRESKLKKKDEFPITIDVLKAAYESSSEMAISNGIELLAQDSSFNSEKLLNRFRRAKKAALFGTDSFWEGVDLPREQLELLILFKLPFTVPDRPWFKANLKKIEENGQSSFARLSVQFIRTFLNLYKG